jgi:hypothetical protein
MQWQGCVSPFCLIWLVYCLVSSFVIQEYYVLISPLDYFGSGLFGSGCYDMFPRQLAFRNPACGSLAQSQDHAMSPDLLQIIGQWFV